MNNGLPRPVTAVVIVAAGSGERLGYGMPKARVQLGGDAILTHALRGVAAAGIARQICVALPPGDTVLQELCAAFAEELRAAHAGNPESPLPLVTTVDGGDTRAASVRSALDALLDGTEAVLVHDAARALTPEYVFHRVVDALAAGAVAVIP
ncbi:MAG TPA: 2-C-methyl-D-erythritol 4-phosphate cytidylyltransferase, partial [Arthrobacter bacterium]|nr:2-C-methyl-D-erythritol 4-phosphate cytidylyltransferase [Arthrobacter sp.]